MSALAREAAAALTLLTRDECSLCEHMYAELQALRRQHCSLPPLTLLDVDSDPQLRRRYGLKIPVLLLDGLPVCSGRLDVAELLRALGRPGGA